MNLEVPHYVVDIETLDTKSTALPIRVWAGEFSLADLLHKDKAKEPLQVIRTFSWSLDPNSPVNAQYSISLGAVVFWIRRAEEFPNSGESLRKLAEGLYKFFTPMASSSTIWTKGHFDLPILEHVFEVEEINCPWKYFHWRDLRTAQDILVLRLKRHDPKEDAISDLQLLYKRFIHSVELCSRYATQY